MSGSGTQGTTFFWIERKKPKSKFRFFFFLNTLSEPSHQEKKLPRASEVPELNADCVLLTMPTRWSHKSNCPLRASFWRGGGAVKKNPPSETHTHTQRIKFKMKDKKKLNGHWKKKKKKKLWEKK